MMDILLLIAFLGLVYGTITDIKTREVPDWVSFSLIIAGLGLRLLYSVTSFDWTFLIHGLTGFGIFFLIGSAMYYTGQWGGGDAKVLMGLGALIGFDFTPFSFLISFFINILLIGALYGLVWSVYVAIKNKKQFSKEFLKQLKKFKRLKRILIIFLIVVLVSIFVIQNVAAKILLLALVIFFYLSFYTYIFIKSVENSSMYKLYDIKKLTEGDWIAKVVKYKGKYICGPKDLGISKKQISLLKKYGIKKVLVKEGIPFIPPKLIAFVVTYFFGNVLFYFL